MFRTADAAIFRTQQKDIRPPSCQVLFLSFSCLWTGWQTTRNQKVHMQKLQLKKCAGFNFYKFFCSHAAKISPTKRKFHKLKCHKKFTVISQMNFACESSVNWCSLYLDSGLPGSTFTQSTHSACTHIYSFTFWTEESY